MAEVVYLLLVTWFTMTGASSYQVEFGSRERCEAAAAALMQEQARMAQGTGQMMPTMPMAPQGYPMMQPMTPMMPGLFQAQVSAVCVER